MKVLVGKLFMDDGRVRYLIPSPDMQFYFSFEADENHWYVGPHTAPLIPDSVGATPEFDEVFTVETDNCNGAYETLHMLLMQHRSHGDDARIRREVRKGVYDICAALRHQDRKDVCNNNV